jgi:hypothetical protein
MKIKANSIEEAREMLLKRGIFAFQKTAGYIPPRAAEFDNLPTFNEVNLYYYLQRNCKEYWFADSTIFRSWLKCNEPLCGPCSLAINGWLGETMSLYVYLESNSRCCCCGDLIQARSIT